MLAVLNQRTHKHFRKVLLRLRNKLKKDIELSEYYFGYGANLDTARFSKNNMKAKEVGAAQLLNHELKFSLPTEYLGKSYAGVHGKENSTVPGVLVRIDRLSLFYLDALEWCGFGAYERKLLEVECGGRIYKAWTYLVRYPDFKRLPSKTYLNNMVKASINRNFDEDYIKFLKHHPSKDFFEIDYSFSLWTYRRSRKFTKTLLPFYKLHDHLREKLCNLF